MRYTLTLLTAMVVMVVVSLLSEFYLPPGERTIFACWAGYMTGSAVMLFGPDVCKATERSGT